MAHIYGTSIGLNYRHQYEPFIEQKPGYVYKSDSIMGKLKSHPHFTVFCRLLEESGRYHLLLDETERGLTVFAPYDKAFQYIDLRSWDMLDKQNFVKFHIVEKVVGANDLKGSIYRVNTLDEKESLIVEGRRGPLLVGGKPINGVYSMVVQEDVEALNGVIHVIDNVLIPTEDPRL